MKLNDLINRLRYARHEVVTSYGDLKLLNVRFSSDELHELILLLERIHEGGIDA